MLAYVTKDGKYISSMTKEELETRKKQRANKKAFIGEKLMKEGLTAQVLRDDPSLMMKDLSKLKSNIEIYRHLLAKEEE